VGDNDKKTGGADGGGSRNRTRHYPLVKNPHKKEENQSILNIKGRLIRTIIEAHPMAFVFCAC
jgi:hypothetical protein